MDWFDAQTPSPDVARGMEYCRRNLETIARELRTLLEYCRGGSVKDTAFEADEAAGAVRCSMLNLIVPMSRFHEQFNRA